MFELNLHHAIYLIFEIVKFSLCHLNQNPGAMHHGIGGDNYMENPETNQPPRQVVPPSPTISSRSSDIGARSNSSISRVSLYASVASLRETQQLSEVEVSTLNHYSF